MESLLVKDKAMVLSKEEYDDIESQLKNYRVFIQKYMELNDTKVLQIRAILGLYSIDRYYRYNRLTGKYEGTILSITYDENENPIVNSKSMAENIVGNFGCLFVSEAYIFFPMPVIIFYTNTVYSCFKAFDIKIKTEEEERQMITVLSNMYKKRVPKKDLFNAVSEYFGDGMTANYFGISLRTSYSSILKSLLKRGYGHDAKTKKKYISVVVKAIYDNWGLLLSSKDVFNMASSRRLWNETNYNKVIEIWEAKRELKYIVSSTPSILTYANLYEKGIESDFGQAILKTLEKKKELESLEKTLFPMERYIADVRGIPYEVPEIEKEGFYAVNYERIYQSVLDDIFRKLKTVG